MNMRVLHDLTGSGFLVLDGKALYRCNQGGAVRGASAAEVPQGQKPIARKQPNAGLKACSTLWQFHLSQKIAVQRAFFQTNAPPSNSPH